MTRRTALLVVPVALAGLTLAGCSPATHTDDQTLDFAGDRLDLVTTTVNMPVTVSKGTPGKVGVSVTTQTALKGARHPELTLRGASLRIGSPCTDSWVGWCEGSYRVTVAPGVSVTLNGQPVTVR